MEPKEKTIEKVGRSVTLKGFIIGTLTLLLLIPGAMIQELIHEREKRSIETTEKINAKWSNAQTLTGPVLVIPYTITTTDEKNKTVVKNHEMTITPSVLDIDCRLMPEERHYGIYKTILYRSDITLKGVFPRPDSLFAEGAIIHTDKARIRIGISDLRGITNNIDFETNGKHFSAEAGGNKQDAIGQSLLVNIGDQLADKQSLSFNCKMKMNGSSEINFIPIGRDTKVNVSGAWTSPGFTGNFSPDYHISNGNFSAKWNVLHFNRSIPECWTDQQVDAFSESCFGVSLVDPVNHYQQNMRSAKYAIMFIALTFVVFFFVEIITKKKIHPIQYLLVGIALILFYSLLLSISEQTGFVTAYAIATVATITLIASYVKTIFKNTTHTLMLAGFLAALYGFLFVILQLEDTALLIGSIGLFVILATLMFFSRKIEWYKPDEEKTDA